MIQPRQTSFSSRILQKQTWWKKLSLETHGKSDSKLSRALQRDPSGESMCAITVGREKKEKEQRKQKKESIETVSLAPVGAADFLVLK